MLTYWIIFTLSLLSIGYFLRIWIGINKALWSVPFAFLTPGYSGLSLIICFLLIDQLKNKYIDLIFQPFLWLGNNPLFIYVCMMFLEILLGSNLKYSNQGSIKNWIKYYLFEIWIP